MHKLMIWAVLSLTFCAVLTAVAQEGDGVDDADACVAGTMTEWSLPQTLEEVIALRETLDEIIEQCTAVPTPAPSEMESRTMYVNTGAGQINMRSAPRLNATVVTKVAHGTPVESLGEVEGDEFRDSTSWHHVRAEDEEGYVHSLLLGETEPGLFQQTTQAQGCSATWHRSGGRTLVKGDDGHDICWQYQEAKAHCPNWGNSKSVADASRTPGIGWYRGGLVRDGDRACILWLLNPVEVRP